MTSDKNDLSLDLRSTRTFVWKQKDTTLGIRMNGAGTEWLWVWEKAENHYVVHTNQKGYKLEKATQKRGRKERKKKKQNKKTRATHTTNPKQKASIVPVIFQSTVAPLQSVCTALATIYPLEYHKSTMTKRKKTVHHSKTGKQNHPWPQLWTAC